LLPLDAVLLLLLLKIAIALDVLLPMTLYLSVVIALGRMYRDSEMIALSSCGAGTPQILKPVIYLSILIALLVASLSLFVRPWAYGKIYQTKAKAESDFDISRMEGGNFYEIPSANLVIFAEKVNHQINRAEQVFIRSQDGKTLQIIHARYAYQQTDDKSGLRVFLLEDVYMYEFERGGDDGRVTEFEHWNYLLEPKETILVGYKRKAASSQHLLDSDNLEDIAELQWRLSTALSTMLLALLGIPLSRTPPRQGQYGKVVVAIVIFAIYYPISVVAKNWIEKGTLNPMPGIWWVPVLLGALALLLLWRQDMRFIRRRT
jgi:lipopolysaccharide export system permease protein